MPQQREQPVQLQTDTITSLPVGVRVIQATVPLAGQPVIVGQQVVAIADGDGNIMDSFFDNHRIARQLLQEMRGVRVLLATWLGYPAVFPPLEELEREPTAP